MQVLRQYLIASISHDSVVKFWDISYLQEDDEDLSTAMALDNVDKLVEEEGEEHGCGRWY